VRNAVREISVALTLDDDMAATRVAPGARGFGAFSGGNLAVFGIQYIPSEFVT